MSLQAIPNMAVRLLPLAIASILSQTALAADSVVPSKPLCAAPWVDTEKLNINIPCLLLPNEQGQNEQFQIMLSFMPAEKPFWTLTDFVVDNCRPHLNACRSVVNLDTLELNLPGLMFAGVAHHLSLKKTGAPNELSWNMPALRVEDPFGNDAIAVSIPLQNITFPNGTTKPFDVGIGSGAFHHPQDPANMFYTITDRGPNIGCEETQAIIGMADFCKDAQGKLDPAGKVFPVPAFTPSIFAFQLGDKFGEYKQLQILPLQDATGNPISGTSNDLRMLDAAGNSTTLSNTENSYAADATLLPFNNNGLDTESLVKLNNGTFWLGEEYAPSLVQVAADGKIINRVVPKGVESQLANAGYPVSGMLPAIFAKRQLNRGIESIAVSPDNKYLYTIVQSPLANPDAAAYKASRNVRLLKMALNEDGSIKEILGEYVYFLDIPQIFVADNSTKQSDVKISEMVALDTDDLIVLERISKHTKLYRVKLNSATNILGTDWDKMATTPSLENTADLAAANITPVDKSLVLDSRKLQAKGTQLPDKVEGVALLDDKYIVLINDDDFGITGAKTQIQVLDAYHDLVGQSGQRIQLQELGRYESGVQNASAAEIVAFHAPSKQVFSINASSAKVDVLDVSDPTKPSKKAEMDVAADVLAGNNFTAGGVNSVAVAKGAPLVAVAVENKDKQANGLVAVYLIADDGSLSYLGSREVGALPDMVTFSPDGRYLVIANEGEPSDDYTNDPAGSISVVDLAVAGAPVRNATFAAFEQAIAAQTLKTKGLRIYGNKGASSVSQDLEPEYITVAPDSQTAYVTLQENNALAIVDLATATVTQIVPLGFKDHSKPDNEMDASDKDGGIHFTNPPVLGMYLPDAIASYEYQGQTYLVTANEGDARAYTGYSEEKRVKDLVLDPTVFPNAAELQKDENLGRLKTTIANGDTDNDGDFDQIYSYGARSFSIWDSQGNQVFDSGSSIGVITANILGMKGFNEDAGTSDGRSDDKGAEPEALTVGKIGERTYAFVGLERTNGILTYDITNPMKPYFIQYVRNAKDVSPEGMAFVPEDVSPNGKPLLIVGNEVSGTVSLYQINVMQY